MNIADDVWTAGGMGRGRRYRWPPAMEWRSEIACEEPMMNVHHDPMNLVGMMSEVAASASELLVPRPLRGVVDRTLVDVACVAGGGVAPVAEHLRVDVPAVDAWRQVGVPVEFRARLTAIALRPTFPSFQRYGRAA